MEKKTVSNEGMGNTIHSTKQSLGLNQIESPSEHLIAGLDYRFNMKQRPFKVCKNYLLATMILDCH